MYLKFAFLFLPLLLISSLLPAQATKDATIAITASFTVNPGSVTLSWPNSAASGLIILRHTKTSPANLWLSMLNVTGSTQTTLVDNVVSAGQTYEYVLQRTVGGIISYGYAHVALNAPVVDNRGKLLFFVDSTLMGPLANEVGQLKLDMMGDGWTVVPHIIGSGATVQSMKNLIVADYNADAANVKMVFLLGALPVPYSGNTNWDGHPDHQGAWPADSYYADVNGVWTDLSINNTVASRTANDNVPGDGKFDQSTIPGNVELAVGRVDFRHLSPTTFGTSQVELYRRYLNKDHAWRMHEYTVENKAIVDDNFGYFNGEAFAANGFRNAYPLVGAANVVEGDLFLNTNPASYLMGMACGGGTYTSASGVGTSANFANDTVNVVFSMLFGSYHGDWDYESDPFMPAALASKGGILTCTWAGRPHVFYEGLASGETIGYCTQETQNAASNTGFLPSYGESGAHVSLLGDPTLRANVVAPAKDLVATLQCGTVNLNWTPPTGLVPAGYNVYRSLVRNGTYTRLTEFSITANTFTDLTAPSDTLYYQVRAVQPVTTPGGGTYLNSSTGATASLIVTPGNPPSLATIGGTITCSQQEVNLVLTSSLPISGLPEWVGPGGVNYSGNSILVSVPGVYSVTVTATNGCTATATVIVTADLAIPTFSGVAGTITCTNPGVTLSAGNFAAGVTWTGPNGFISTQAHPTVMVPGLYSTTVTAGNGCSQTGTVSVLIDTFLPTLPLPVLPALTCNTLCISAALPLLPGYQIYVDGVLLPSGLPLVLCQPGQYTISLRSTANGCQDNYPITINQNVTPPGATATGGALACNMPLQLLGSSATPNVVYQWTGPGGFVSNLQNPVVTAPGTYSLVVTNPGNGCTSTATAVVTNPSGPTASATGTTLTCNEPTGMLHGASSTSGVTYTWTGPNGFTSNQQNPTVNAGGNYLLVVTAPNGCTGSVNVPVLVDTNAPAVTATGGALNCNLQTAVLHGNSTTAGVTYFWTGPNGFTSTEQNPTASFGGDYLLVVTAPNGCSNSAMANVSIDANLPTATATGATLGCTQPAVLQGHSATVGASYLWTGPFGFSSNQPNPAVIVPGVYTLVVTGPNGCSASATAEVTLAPPLHFEPTTTTLLDCAGNFTMSVEVTGGTPPYLYLWSTGATTAIVTIPPGTATSVSVTVSDAGGCSLVSPLIGVPPFIPTEIGATVVDEVGNAQNGAIVLSVMGMNCSNPIYLWSNGATGSAIVNLSAGTYTVTVTCSGSGCTVVVTATVNSTVVGTEDLNFWKKLTLSPNPTDGEARLEVQFPTATDLKVQVLDATGRVMLSLPETNILTGSLTLDLRHFPPGMYTVLLSTSAGTAVRKLVVVRN